VGGGAEGLERARDRRAGRSPRGRRSRLPARQAHRGEGSISAWAEEPGVLGSWCGLAGVDLRVGGGAPCGPRSPVTEMGRSPRGRRSLIHGLAGRLW